MHFVKSDALTESMRVARPILDKKGRTVISCNDKLTSEKIELIRNSGLPGVFVLSPAEPVAPYSEEDAKLDSFRSVNAATLSNEMKEIVMTHRLHRLEYLADEILAAYGNIREKIHLTLDVRTYDDFIFKHSINVTIIAAKMAARLGLTPTEKRACVFACLFHDFGKTLVPQKLLEGEPPEEVLRVLDISQDIGFEYMDSLFPDLPAVKKSCIIVQRMLSKFKAGREQDKEWLVAGADVLMVVEMFDELTSVKITGEADYISYVAAIRYMLEFPDTFKKNVVNALASCIDVFAPGMTVLMNNGKKAVVTTLHPEKSLYPMVLEMGSNRMIDLSDRNAYPDLEIVDVVGDTDNRVRMNF